jgi:hypothetical protein
VGASQGVNPTMRMLVRHHIASSRWAPLVRHGGPAKPSDIGEHIGEPIVRHRYRLAAGTDAPRPTVVLRGRVETTVRQILTESSSTLGSAIEAHIAVMDDVMRALQAKGIGRSRGEVSEKVAVRVGRHFCLTPDDPLDQAALVLAVCGLLDIAPPLSKAAFSMRFAGVFTERWERRGTVSCTAYPPAAVQLGSNSRPHLTVPHSENWTVGSDRSVYGRYMLYFKESARGRGDAASAVDPTGAGDVEVNRACEPYGLNHPQHHVVVASVAVGVRVDASALGDKEHAQRVRGVWKRWRGAEGIGPDSIDLDLVAAAEARAMLWAIATRTSQTQSWYTLTLADGLLARFVVRKLWMRLHGCERLSDEPASRDDVARFMSNAMHGALWEGLAAYLTSSPAGDDGVWDRPSAIAQEQHDAAVREFVSEHGETPHEHTERINRTLALLAEHLDVAQIVTNPGSDGAQRYADNLRELGGPRWSRLFLSWNDIRSWIGFAGDEGREGHE